MGRGVATQPTTVFYSFDVTEEKGGLCTSHITQNIPQVTTEVANPRDGEMEAHCLREPRVP
jgi:hypothetical protein